MTEDKNPEVGAVVIGRNEGDRLKLCLSSVIAQIETVVYVDSGSHDGSPEYAATLGVEIVDLDMSIPFSAGRARNEGFNRLLQLGKKLEFVQFIDGDCELNGNWITYAKQFLTKQSSYAIVSGLLEERNPEKSIYNELCNIEWKRPEGDALSCGGIFLARITAISSVNGFSSEMIAGEEPELCFRLRQKNWKIYNSGINMALHDANMLYFKQWWKRSVRSGYAYTHRYFIHTYNNDEYLKKATIRIWFWTIILPFFAFLLSIMISPLFMITLLAYLVQLIRSYRHTLRFTRNKRTSFLYSFFNALGKWPQLIGQITFIYKRLKNQQKSIIEYK
ncbi:glycosyltransferase [Spirochaeta isovalerica]|uniref:Glycosyltransferase involved in cell wall biosynthesis n=1 Tax=Spirochaeta isovalerica TaxID=150 RepID=A0A841R8G0_9SPIO|nr:glycosyltransferase family 2 protein [Spirochaeta isovalerica]MBB6479249.1 glycosyltransferase involved in cell wall biosynthesis [Spirochaeta isovalerica]